MKIFFALTAILIALAIIAIMRRGTLVVAPSKKRASGPMSPEKIRELSKWAVGEILNGGFDQFFYNTAGDHTEDIISAFIAIGAENEASILRAAARKFPGGMPPTNRWKRQDLLLDVVSPDCDAFKEQDALFFACQENVIHLIDDYAPV